METRDIKRHVILNKRFFLLLIAGLASLAGLFGQTASVSNPLVPDFKLQDQNGQEIQLHEFRGKYVHLDISADWCGPCRHQASYMANLEHELEKYDFVSISVIVTRNSAAVKKWAEQYRLQYVLFDSENMAKRVFNARGYPTNIIIRPDLTIAGRWAGAPPSAVVFHERLKQIVPEMFKNTNNNSPDK